MVHKNLPTTTKIKLYLEKIRAISDFADNKIFALANTLSNLNNKQITMLKIYQRMNLLIDSVQCLNIYKHYQSVCAVARSAFEMIIDLRALSIDNTGETLERYLRFSQIEIYRWGKEVNKFYSEHPDLLMFDISTYKWWVENPDIQEMIKQSSEKYWPKAKDNLWKIQHWSDKRRRELCRYLDKNKPSGRECYLRFEELFVMIYSRLSWFIHSGETGLMGFNQQINEIFVCDSLLNIEDIFCESTQIIAREIEVYELTNSMFDVLEEIDRKFNRIL
ncbi:MAG: DUF5677 domain-containing protein [bacterium]